MRREAGNKMEQWSEIHAKHVKCVSKSITIARLVSRPLKQMKDGTEDTLTRNTSVIILFHFDRDGGDDTKDIIVAATAEMPAM